MCEYILKARQYWICNGKEAKLFYFSKWQIPHIRAKQDNIQGTILLFVQDCFYRDEDDLALNDRFYILGKRNALWFWQHFGRTITLAVFDIPIVSTESQVLYSFIIKVRVDTPICLFSNLLFIELNTNSTYIIWLKTIFCNILFSKFLTCYYFLFFLSSSSIADSGTVCLDIYIKIIVICRNIHRT